MPHRWRDTRGFTGIEMMVVVVVIALIGGAVAGTHVYMKNRASERVVQGDLDNYAQAQMGAWTEEGHFASHEALLASRFGGWSDDVELSEVRTANDRFFLRLRHSRTGYSCALDLSPRTGSAINRKVCRASESDPALAAPGIGVTVPPGDTTSVSRPPGTPSTSEGMLLPPEVGDVAEVVIDPGSSRVVMFPVTNRSNEARTFMFAASSANPGAVPDPARPADAQLEAEEAATIPVTVTVTPGTLADVVSDVELRAVDVADRAYMGTGGVRVRAALLLASPAVEVPPAEIRDPGETFTVQYRVRNRTNAARVLRFAASMPAGSALSLAGAVADQSLDADEERVVPVTYRLDPGVDGGSVWSARLVVSDRDAPTVSTASDPYQVTDRLILAAPLEGSYGSRTESPGMEFTILWQVSNRSNAPRDFRLTPGSDSPDLQPVQPAGVFTQRIGRGEVASVPVTYRMSGTAVCTAVFSASLRAEDAGEPVFASAGSGTVRTATVLSNPAVVTPSDRSDEPMTTFTSTWRITNRTNCERDVRVEVVADGDLAITGSTGAGIVRMKPYEQRAVSVSYHLADMSLYQTQSRPVVRATDQAVSAFTASGSFLETTALRLCDPSLLGPVSAAAQPQQPGTSGLNTYRVTNCANAPRTFSVSVVSSNPAAVPDPVDPADVTIPAFGTVDVAYGYGVPALAGGASFADLLMQVMDAGDDALRDVSSFRVTVAVVAQAPVWTAFASQEVRPSDAGSSAAVLTSRSNVPVDYCFSTSVVAGTVAAGSVVAPAPAGPGCIRLGAYQSASVTQPFTVASVAEHPWTNGIQVRASDAARPGLTADQSFVVTAGLVLANPTLEVPGTPPAVVWMLGQDRTVSYTVANRSNSSRDLCVAVTPGGELAVVDATPVCVNVGAGKVHVFAHALRGALAGEGAVDVSAYDQVAPEYKADGRFEVRVVDAKPVAVWSPPAPVFVRKWAEFDASRSFSPVGARIVKYIWSWGLFNQRWTGARFEPSGSGVATNEEPEPVTRRAWDIRGTFEICLTVEDEGGRRSAPSCGAITTLVETRARLAFRYRGWWYDPSDFCWDVPWDNQCPKEHGNARWEILLNQSQGDVPIKRAWATFRVDYWQTDDEFERTYSYSGNVETLPYQFVSGSSVVTYDFFSNRHKANGSVESGRWRILDTNGTAALGWPQAPNLGNHPLVLNANLGSATGAFDGGPHWVPDEVWITLFVEDADGNVTQQSRFLDHKRSEWRGEECINGTSGLFGCVRGYERLTPPQEVPVVTMNREDLADRTYRFSGSGTSPDGRVVDSWWEITRSTWDLGGNTSTSTYRGSTYEVRLDVCDIVDVSLVYVDDRGQQGRAWDRVSDGDPRKCVTVGTPL